MFNQMKCTSVSLMFMSWFQRYFLAWKQGLDKICIEHYFIGLNVGCWLQIGDYWCRPTLVIHVLTHFCDEYIHHYMIMTVCGMIKRIVSYMKIFEGIDMWICFVTLKQYIFHGISFAQCTVWITIVMHVFRADGNVHDPLPHTSFYEDSILKHKLLTIIFLKYLYYLWLLQYFFQWQPTTQKYY